MGFQLSRLRLRPLGMLARSAGQVRQRNTPEREPEPDYIAESPPVPEELWAKEQARYARRSAPGREDGRAEPGEGTVR